MLNLSLWFNTLHILSLIIWFSGLPSPTWLSSGWLTVCRSLKLSALRQKISKERVSACVFP